MELSADIVKRGNIVIYGAGSYGELALLGLKYLGTEPDFFIDRGRKEKEYFGYPVLRPDEIEKYKNKTFLIASADYYYDIYLFLEDVGCEKIYDISYLLNLPLDTGKMSNRTKDKYDTRSNYSTVAKGSTLTVVHMGYCVTEKCSLKCKDCSFLMQYYQHPQNIDIEKYQRSFERFLETVDRVCELRIYGGEPFMNPDWYKIIKWNADNEKIDRISIYTNGTIIPQERTLKYLSHKKVKLHISNYGFYDELIIKMKEYLEKNNIQFFIRIYDEWVCAGDFEKQLYSDIDLAKKYSRCFLNTSGHFLKGKYYSCPRAAHIENIRAIKADSNDSVDFNEDLSIEVFQKKMMDILHKKPFLNACRFCPGMDIYGEKVKAAIQTKNPLDYKKEI